MKENKIAKYGITLLATILSSYSPAKPINNHNLENKIELVANSDLTPGTSGQYDPRSGHGITGKDLPDPYRNFVMVHEANHAAGIGGSPREEYLNDILAANRTSHGEFIRGPFYRPPINLK